MAGWRCELAGCRSILSMSKIKVRISETNYHSFYKTLPWCALYISFPYVYCRVADECQVNNSMELTVLLIKHKRLFLFSFLKFARLKQIQFTRCLKAWFLSYMSPLTHFITKDWKFEVKVNIWIYLNIFCTSREKELFILHKVSLIQGQYVLVV